MVKLRNPLVDQTPRNPLRLGQRAARWGALAVLIAVAVIAWPVATGYLEGRGAAPDYAAQADALIAAGSGSAALGPGRFDLLLAVQDPGFRGHKGVDLQTPGAGITTITQSLAKRLGFNDFAPGWAKLRQTGLALGYETGMTKEQIAALWLDTVEMGRIEGTWSTGLFPASDALFDRPPAALSLPEFASLVARFIAPATLGDDPGALAGRVDRILRLWDGDCAPIDHGDVWLEGCA